MIFEASAHKQHHSQADRQFSRFFPSSRPSFQKNAENMAIATSTRPAGRSARLGVESSFTRLFICICVLLLFGPRTAAASEQLTLQNLTQCSLTCLVGGISRTNCSALDIACQCQSTELRAVVADCLLTNCTMQDSLETSRFTAQQCNLSHDSQSTEVIVIMSVLYGAAVIFILLRAVSKWMTRTFWMEDYIIISSTLLAAAPLACVIDMATLGFGAHVWDLKDGALKQILRLFYVGEILYVAALALTKISLVFMYLRIFQAYRPFQLASYAMLAFIAIPSLVIIMFTILSCRPIAYFWDRDLSGHCLDVTALAYANSALAVAQDVLLIAMPVFMLWNLNMNRRKKWFIACMFAVGSLGLVATIVRLSTLHVFGNLEDPTWDYVPVVYWTVVELAAGMICSCLPAIRLLLERFFGVLHMSTHQRSHPSDAIKMGNRQRKASYPEDSLWNDSKWPDDSVSQRKLTLSRDGTVVERPPAMFMPHNTSDEYVDERQDGDFI